MNERIVQAWKGPDDKSPKDRHDLQRVVALQSDRGDRNAHLRISIGTVLYISKGILYVLHLRNVTAHQRNFKVKQRSSVIKNTNVCKYTLLYVIFSNFRWNLSGREI